MNRFHQKGTNLYLVSGIGFKRYLHLNNKTNFFEFLNIWI